MEIGSSAVSLYNPPSLNSLPDQRAGHSGLLVEGQGEVGQVDGGTLRGPVPDQASLVLVQHCHKCCQLYNVGTIGNISARLGDKESQGGSEHLHLHQHSNH